MKNLIELWFNSIFNVAKLSTIFTKKIEFGAVQKDVNLVDLEKCCNMSIYLQNLASIQPRTSLSKFGGWFNSIFNPLLTSEPFFPRVARACIFSCGNGSARPACTLAAQRAKQTPQRVLGEHGGLAVSKRSKCLQFDSELGF